MPSERNREVAPPYLNLVRTWQRLQTSLKTACLNLAGFFLFIFKLNKNTLYLETNFLHNESIKQLSML